MKKFTIVTTYPEHGSKNIGDQLITNSLLSMIEDICYFQYEIKIIWREAPYASIEEHIKNSDAIIFACLAIRPDFTIKQYPYIDKVIESGKPIYIVSSGTSLDVSSNFDLKNYLSPKSKSTLIELSKVAKHFGVRGALSYDFLKGIGLNNINFTGDIAFYDKEYIGKPFQLPQDITSIVISDPHRGVAYLNAFKHLLTRLKLLFPNAKITVALHGENKVISDLCESKALDYINIYSDKNEGLKIYDDADIHVGFRVHAHVSMLKRRKVSYLLEQDGRGADYGLSIPYKVSVPCYQYLFNNLSLKILNDLLKFKDKHVLKQASTNCVDLLISMISLDYEDKFKRFDGLDKSIDGFNKKLLDSLDEL